MAYERKPGDGVLFQNNRKTSDNSPDMVGEIMVNEGEVKQLAAWTKTDKNGKKFLAVRVSDAYQKPTGETKTTNGNLPF